MLFFVCLFLYFCDFRTSVFYRTVDSLIGSRVLLSRKRIWFDLIFENAKLVESCLHLLICGRSFLITLTSGPHINAGGGVGGKRCLQKTARRRRIHSVDADFESESLYRTNWRPVGVSAESGGLTPQIVEAVSPVSASICVFVQRTSPSYESAWETARHCAAASLAKGRRQLNIVSAAASRGDSSSASSTEWQLKWRRRSWNGEFRLLRLLSWTITNFILVARLCCQ